MRMGPLDLYKTLPRTNCGDCGQPSCLAFATQVVGYGHKLRDCWHLEEVTVQNIEKALERQRDEGVYLKRENHKIARDHLKEKISNHNFEAIAPGLDVVCVEEDGVRALEIPYFGNTVTMRHGGILPREEFDPWDEILLYNYIFFSGSKPLSGRWVGLESFPNSLSKRVALEDGCHRRINQAFAGAQSELEKACGKLGGAPVTDGHNADLAYKFIPLPKMPLLLLFWDEDEEEGFDSQTKVLFDECALEYLDLEGLTFVAEKLAENLISLKKEELNV